MWYFIYILLHLENVIGLRSDAFGLAFDYYSYRDVKYLCYLSCDNQFNNKVIANKFVKHNVRVSVALINSGRGLDLERLLHQWDAAVGVMLDGSCDNAQDILNEASERMLLDSMHIWLLLHEDSDNCTTQYGYIDETFQGLNLSIDADVITASYCGSHYELTDVFNFGKIQGNNLETKRVGIWTRHIGLLVSLKGFKYYNRWDFHNLTLRAVSVILEHPKVFYPEMLSEEGYTPGVSSMTKVTSQLLNILKLQHNFRFNYTIVGRWIGSPERNSTLAVTNSLYWREQDISSTCARVFPAWLQWIDPFFPPATYLETKFYYLIPDKGAGEYEDRFLTPMSASVWWCAGATAFACGLLLAAGAVLEKRSEPALYAFFSVFAAACQQDYEDGIQLTDEARSSQGRRLVLLVIGLTSMLFYNYYTSSVVSWLLNAAAPTIATMDGLIDSNLELIFEDIGYTRGWLDNPGFFYYSGIENRKEDMLRDKKVKYAKRTVPLLQPVEAGIELVRTGGYAYHTEPYTASRVIGKTYDDKELCELGALQMMKPSHVYIMGQKQSPYKQFFVWSMMRLLERGHVSASRARVSGYFPRCSGRSPRALALGQAAPAFAVLVEATIVALFMLAIEYLWRRVELRNKRR